MMLDCYGSAIHDDGDGATEGDGRKADPSILKTSGCGRSRLQCQPEKYSPHHGADFTHGARLVASMPVNPEKERGQNMTSHPSPG